MPISPYLAALRRRVGSELLVVPSVAVRVLDGEGRLLLVRSRDSGSWSLPAGAIELGETPRAAAERELLEETGIQATNLRLIEGLGGEAFRFVYPNGDRVEYQIFVFQADGPADGWAEGPGSAEVDREIRDLRFFDQSDAPAIALPYPDRILWGAE